MKLRLSLGAYLDEHHISADRVVQESQGRLARHTLDALAHTSARRINLDTVGELLSILSKIQGHPVQLADLLDVREEVANLDAETRAWQDAELMTPLEPYDWGEAGEPEGLKVDFVPGQGFVVERM